MDFWAIATLEQLLICGNHGNHKEYTDDSNNRNVVKDKSQLMIKKMLSHRQLLKRIITSPIETFFHWL
jgi:hypothetical protein